MAAIFERDGVCFQYPENWKLESDDTETGWTATVQSPDTAMLVVAFDEDMPEPEHMAQTALEAIKEEYKDVESEEALESIAGQPAVGHDVRFFSFDLTNTCLIRSFYTSRGAVLVMWEANDLELAQNEPVLRAITASLKVEDD
ncbi:MAG: hypothetical protein HY040_03615 [Planctomycetes bacterium]|nr:hypothetical protein [Planctomycetota bacterium]